MMSDKLDIEEELAVASVFKVKFLKGTDELNLPDAAEPGAFHGDGYSGHPYTYKEGDGSVWLRIGNQMYHWTRGVVGRAFSKRASRSAYMKKLNDACGEVVAVAAEEAA